MPKESKKFINPLLRPSQEVETKTDLPGKLQKSPSEVVAIEAPLVPGLVSQSGSERGAIERSPEKATFTENAATSSSTNTSTSTETDAFIKSRQRREGNEEQRDHLISAAQTSPPFIATTVLETEKSHLSDTSLPPQSGITYSSVMPRELVMEPQHTFTSTPTETSTDTSTSTLNTVRAKQKPGQIKSTQIIQPEQEVAQPLISEATLRTDQEIAQPETLAEEPVYKRPKERPAFTAAEAVRRKRGPLAFENTHERITLWIDKGLKQGFEELASERELPKTALLNEAIADLLRKYDLQ